MADESEKNGAGQTAELSSEEEKQAEETQRALLERPQISIRLRITLSFLLLFIILCGMGIASFLFITQFDSKQKFLETTSNYAFEVQQARRYEKNFFLYGTNLKDALSNVQAAQNVLRFDREDMISVIGDEKFTEMEQSLNRYEALLNRVHSLHRSSNPADSLKLIPLESDLRKYGSEILANASSAINQERLEIYRLISTGKFAVVVSLIFFLLSIGYIISFLTRQILRPINRAIEYTQRIAEGDFSPVKPMRKYRDEFSNLAMALNRMIHEIRAHQDQLTQSRKMAAIGNLTAGIAHELNNPLNNISLTTETLLEDFDDYSKEEKLKMLHDIFDQVERAGSTVRNLLDFTRVEKPIFTSVSVSELVNTTLKLLKNEFTLNDIQVEPEIDKNLPPVNGNPKNLQQVLLNLLLNGVQAMPDGGTLKVKSTLKKDGFIRIDVTDTGIGIPSEYIDKIFDPFFTTKEVGKGTGLGLAVSHGIIENHKGKITVLSKIGKGTTFSVFLPYQINPL
ncbi:MAG TPA: sensor histidine kinase [Bacteroidetes bacterium]|nr:sensor histidine kinase [Bacteroidota bacterium]